MSSFLEASLQRNVNTAHCTLHTAHCTLHTVHCTLHTAHCTLRTAHCTLQTTHCTLHTASGTPYPDAHFVLPLLTPFCSIYISFNYNCDQANIFNPLNVQRLFICISLHCSTAFSCPLYCASRLWKTSKEFYFF